MIPTRFRLLNRSWKVKLVTSKQIAAAQELSEDKGKAYLGICDLTNHRILLNKDEHDSAWELEQTFWHEVAHCMFIAEGLQPYEHDEKAVERMGSFLHQLEETRGGCIETFT